MPSQGLSESTKKLIQQYKLAELQDSAPANAPAIHVDEVALRVAAFYEHIRTVVDWKEEHLMRRAAIIRKLKRRFLNLDDYKPTAMTLMLQKEVAERICAKPGAMSLLAISVQVFCQPEITYMVSKNDFWPQPKVNSAIIKIRDINRKIFTENGINEEKFWETDCWVGKFADSLEPGNYSSREFLRLIAGTLEDSNSILKTAVKHGVPVFSPALNDSSIGIGLTEHYHRKKVKGQPHVSIDSIRDNYELTQLVVKSRATAAIYVAGGVPKNYINDSVVMSYIFGRDTGGHKYCFQVTTDSPHWGGLSGSTLKEATSWGKVNKKASSAMAFVEPTVSLPLIVSYALQKNLSKNRTRLRLKWRGDILADISAA